MFGYHQVLDLVNIPTSALTLRKFSHSGDRKLRFLFFVYFSDLKTIYSYFITITFFWFVKIVHGDNDSCLYTFLKIACEKMRLIIAENEELVNLEGCFT